MDGLLLGNKAVRENPEGNADVIAKAFANGTDQNAGGIAEGASVVNLPEQMAFFSGGHHAGREFCEHLSIGGAGVWAGADSQCGGLGSFSSLDALKAAQATGVCGAYGGDHAAVIRAGVDVGSGSVLSQDIRFFFEPKQVGPGHEECGQPEEFEFDQAT